MLIWLFALITLPCFSVFKMRLNPFNYSLTANYPVSNFCLLLAEPFFYAFREVFLHYFSNFTNLFIKGKQNDHFFLTFTWLAVCVLFNSFSCLNLKYIVEAKKLSKDKFFNFILRTFCHWLNVYQCHGLFCLT